MWLCSAPILVGRAKRVPARYIIQVYRLRSLCIDDCIFGSIRAAARRVRHEGVQHALATLDDDTKAEPYNIPPFQLNGTRVDRGDPRFSVMHRWLLRCACWNVVAETAGASSSPTARSVSLRLAVSYECTDDGDTEASTWSAAWAWLGPYLRATGV